MHHLGQFVSIFCFSFPLERATAANVPAFYPLTLAAAAAAAA